MTVRLGFAVAAHLDPDILIVDEVLAVGDAAFQKKCLGKMEDISNDGKTIIFVSHQMPMVEKLCKDTLLLKDGIIQNFGKTKDIVNLYLKSSNPFCKDEHTVKWLDRKGSGDITLSKIKINSTELGESSNVKLGDKISFFLYFNCKNKNLNHSEISFRFAVNNEQQMRVTTLDSRSTNFIIKPASAFSIKVNINKVSFPVGRYYITSFIGNEENPYDWITNAIFFNVIPGDFYKTGRMQDMSPGEILIDHEMNLLHV
jgi:lipopolysaccharide transport system ATP-binding protein